VSPKLVIVGGVAGGATAAARARRLDERAEIVLIERGEYISFANCGLPYYVGRIIEERDDLLVTTPEDFRRRYHIDIRIFSRVTRIDRNEKRIEIFDVASERTYWESYDRLILSPGAEPVRPPLEGVDLENVFSLRSIPDSDRIKQFVDQSRPSSAVVVGGGFIGLEMAENLSHRGVRTTIVEMLDQVLAPLDFEMAGLVQAHLEEQGVELALGNGVESLAPKDGRLVVRTDQGREIDCDLVVLSIGVRPESVLAREAGLEIGPRGHIKVDASMRTSDPDIFAVGDAVEIVDFVTGQPTAVALAGPANKQARIAADNALGRSSLFHGALGTAIVKVFDMAAATTGACEKVLKRLQSSYRVSYTHSNSHASYYPGAGSMAIKLVFKPGSGRLLGAQIVGRDGVDKRIDVLATAIRAGMTVFDLEELELSYAPPYSSAKDPVNIAGFVAANMLKGDASNETWWRLAEADPAWDIMIDLRGQDEIDELGTIPGSIHVPLDELRSKLPELDRSKRYLLFCAVGMRGYVGYRIMVQNGFQAVNLAGGFSTYQGGVRPEKESG